MSLTEQDRMDIENAWIISPQDGPASNEDDPMYVAVGKIIARHRAEAAREALERYAPQVWESGRVGGVIDALRAHGPRDETERLLWVVMTPPTEENPYAGVPFDFAAHDEEASDG